LRQIFCEGFSEECVVGVGMHTMLAHRLHSEEEEEEEPGLEIDLDYNDFVSVSLTEDEAEEPLDLRVRVGGRDETDSGSGDLGPDSGPDTGSEPPSPLGLRPEALRSPEDVGKGALLTENQVTSLLEPYIVWDRKRAVCTVCNIKFVKREKARAHLENKHLDCFQYKCPLCRASKVTRLAYESHLRRGHSAKARDYTPQIRLKRRFGLKSEPGSGGEGRGLAQYDLEFVTFLRGVLSLGGEEGGELSWHRALAPAEWLDREQGIFRINNRHEFASGWYTFKGLDHVSWDNLYSSVITSFRERNILKQLTKDELVFQVFCIKQLLK